MRLVLIVLWPECFIPELLHWNGAFPLPRVDGRVGRRELFWGSYLAVPLNGSLGKQGGRDAERRILVLHSCPFTRVRLRSIGIVKSNVGIVSPVELVRGSLSLDLGHCERGSRGWPGTFGGNGRGQGLSEAEEYRSERLVQSLPESRSYIGRARAGAGKWTERGIQQEQKQKGHDSVCRGEGLKGVRLACRHGGPCNCANSHGRIKIDFSGQALCPPRCGWPRCKK